MIAGAATISIVGDQGFVRALVAAVAVWAVLRLGMVVVVTLAQPRVEPPPPGELRKVHLNYRCSVCGTEVRMTSAMSETPVPPRHCMDEMELVSASE